MRNATKTKKDWQQRRDLSAPLFGGEGLFWPSLIRLPFQALFLIPRDLVRLLFRYDFGRNVVHGGSHFYVLFSVFLAANWVPAMVLIASEEFRSAPPTWNPALEGLRESAPFFFMFVLVFVAIVANMRRRRRARAAETYQHVDFQGRLRSFGLPIDFDDALETAKWVHPLLCFSAALPLLVAGYRAFGGYLVALGVVTWAEHASLLAWRALEREDRLSAAMANSGDRYVTEAVRRRAAQPITEISDADDAQLQHRRRARSTSRRPAPDADLV